MSQQDDGGPAFPIAPAFHSPGLGLEVWTAVTVHPGMSLRDWFAGQALAGMCANSYGAERFGLDYATAAVAAYAHAAAMLAEREKVQP